MNAVLTGMEKEFIWAGLPTLGQQDGCLRTCPAALSPLVFSGLDMAAPTSSSEDNHALQIGSVSSY